MYERDPDWVKLVQQAERPTVESVLPMARRLGITEGVKLFQLHERVMAAWQDFFVEG